MKDAKHFAKILLDIKAVNLRPDQPFVWTSGLRSPIYCDNRLIISYPSQRGQIETGLIELIRTHFPQVDLIAGTATAGIPHAAIIADRMNLPMIYVRSSAKSHGKQNAIEGHIQPHQNVVMVEDLISTGGSVIQAADQVSQAGGKILGAVAIFNYLLPKSAQAFQTQSYPLYTLTNYQALLELVKEEGLFTDYQDMLAQWHHDPESWSQRY